MKLSIIIPVYKVEKYLDFCLKSICRQTVNDCEILLIDDCSPDRSGEICDEWSRKDTRIRVVHHPENRGLSVARNTGLDMATGEYVTFIDSDDYIAPDTLPNNMALLDRHNEADILEYPVCVYHGTVRAYRYRPGKERLENFIEWIQRKGYIHCYAWNKIYRRSLWKNRRFPVGKFYEDSYTIPYVVRDAGKILCSNYGMYYYCSHTDSISNTLTMSKEKDLLQSNIQLFNNLVKDENLTEKDRDEMYLHLCNCQIVYLRMGGKQLIPEHRISFKRALLTRRPRRMYIKAIMNSLFGNKYCKVVAKTRKTMKK